MRQFDTGANRNSDEGKLDIEGFANPLADQSFYEYMHKNRHLEDGTFRDADNWQKGIPPEELLKSLLRHVHDVRMYQRGYEPREDIITALNAVRFNTEALKLHYLQDGNTTTDHS